MSERVNPFAETDRLIREAQRRWHPEEGKAEEKKEGEVLPTSDNAYAETGSLIQGAQARWHRGEEGENASRTKDIVPGNTSSQMPPSSSSPSSPPSSPLPPERSPVPERSTRERAGVEKALRHKIETEAAYLHEYRRLFRNRSLGDLAEGRLDRGEYDNLERLKKERDDARLAFERAVEESIQARASGEGQRSEQNVRQGLETTKPREDFPRSCETLSQLRIERMNQEQALREKDRAIARKAFAWKGRENRAKERRFGRVGARAARILALAGALTGAAAVSYKISDYFMHLPSVREAVTARIDKPGEGADELFSDLKHNLQKLYPDPSKAPPEARLILQTHPHKLSEKYAFAKTPRGDLPGQSAVMHEGDTLRYDPQTGHLTFSKIIARDAGGHAEHVGNFEGSYKPDHTPARSPANSPSSRVPLSSPVKLSSPVNPPSPPPSFETPSHEKPSSKIVLPPPFPPKKIEHPAPPLPPASVTVSHEAVRSFKGGGSPVSADTLPPSSVETPPSVAQGQFHGQIEDLLHTAEAEHYAEKPLSEVLYDNPAVSPHLHAQLMSIVTRAGVGPENNETFAHFLERAQKAVAARGVGEYLTGMNGLRIPLQEISLYTDTEKRIIAFGGNYAARAFIAYEYLLAHPGSQVIVTGAAGEGAMVFSNTARTAGRPIIAYRFLSGPAPRTDQFVERVTN